MDRFLGRCYAAPNTSEIPTHCREFTRSIQVRTSESRFWCPRFVIVAEGELQFARDLLLELTEHIKAHVLDEGVSDTPPCRPNAAFVARMICVAKDNGARGSQPLGIIRHVRAILAVSHKHVACRMKKTLSHAAVRQPVIARVFGKDRRICKVLEEFRRCPIREVRREALTIARGALPERWICVRGLVYTRREASTQKGHRVQRVLGKQNELIFQLEGAQDDARLVVRRVY